MAVSTKIHDGCIKITRIRRYLTLLAFKTFSHFHKFDGPCIPIWNNMMLKSGPLVQLEEAITIQFIANNTKIPVPHIYCSFRHKGMNHIVMERIKGQSLAAALKNMPESELDSILAQLRELLKELRSIPASGTPIQSCAGGSLRDLRIPRKEPRFGPFPSSKEFHQWLRQDFRLQDYPDHKDDEEWKDIKWMIEMQDRQYDAPVLTHGDLNPFNIMVRGGRIVSIIDWEFAGWYPPYWEYTSVWVGNRSRRIWQNMADKFLDPWPEELRMEHVGSKWWGEV